jgi:hypothetical protein
MYLLYILLLFSEHRSAVPATWKYLFPGCYTVTWQLFDQDHTFRCSYIVDTRTSLMFFRCTNVELLFFFVVFVSVSVPLLLLFSSLVVLGTVNCCVTSSS